MSTGQESYVPAEDEGCALRDFVHAVEGGVLGEVVADGLPLLGSLLFWDLLLLVHLLLLLALRVVFGIVLGAVGGCTLVQMCADRVVARASGFEAIHGIERDLRVLGVVLAAAAASAAAASAAAAAAARAGAWRARCVRGGKGQRGVRVHRVEVRRGTPTRAWATVLARVAVGARDGSPSLLVAGATHGPVASDQTTHFVSARPEAIRK